MIKIVVQHDGLYSLWNTVVDAFTAYNMTVMEVAEYDQVRNGLPLLRFEKVAAMCETSKKQRDGGDLTWERYAAFVIAVRGEAAPEVAEMRGFCPGADWPLIAERTEQCLNEMAADRAAGSNQ